jgi:hypothetical protein
MRLSLFSRNMARISSLVLGLTVAMAGANLTTRSLAARSPSWQSHSQSQGTLQAEARPGFQLYRYGNRFTIEYPTGWIVNDPGEFTPGITILNRQPSRVGGGRFPADFVKTNVGIHPQSFNAYIRDFERSDYEEITRRGEITIGGRRALRLWTESVDSYGIYSIIEYSNNQTAVIVSFYGSSDWVPMIQDIHWSFRRLD